MVGTIEPRKGHLQTIKAFEILWRSGQEIILVIVGKRGWLVDELVAYIESHPERNKRLIWLEGISDEYLEMIYSNCTCLIAASECEGFGLPLIEASIYGIPIIARDIPVFREVAGDNAYFFESSNDVGLAEEVNDWLKQYHSNRHQPSNGIKYLKWHESAQAFTSILTNVSKYV